MNVSKSLTIVIMMVKIKDRRNVQNILLCYVTNIFIY
jgi:hypothetical protein